VFYSRSTNYCRYYPEARRVAEETWARTKARARTRRDQGSTTGEEIICFAHCSVHQLLEVAPATRTVPDLRPKASMHHPPAGGGAQIRPSEKMTIPGIWKPGFREREALKRQCRLMLPLPSTEAQNQFCLVATSALFVKIRLSSGAGGVKFEKRYDWAKETKREDVPRETPRVMTDTIRS